MGLKMTVVTGRLQIEVLGLLPLPKKAAGLVIVEGVRGVGGVSVGNVRGIGGCRVCGIGGCVIPCRKRA
jgi:hypothetical protein